MVDVYVIMLIALRFVLTVVRCLIEAKRPVEYDRTMQPLTDRGADSYGCVKLCLFC